MYEVIIFVNLLVIKLFNNYIFIRNDVILVGVNLFIIESFIGER